MFRIKVNKRLLPMKCSFFFLYSTIAPIYGFLPTKARQLGYSITTYGTVMTVLSMFSMVIVPSSGIVAERYHKKKLFYFISVLLVGLFSFLLVFVPKVPLETVVKLECDEANVLTVNAESVVSTTFPNGTVSINNSTGKFVCNMNCHGASLYEQLNNQSDLNTDRLTTTRSVQMHRSNIDVLFKLNNRRSNGSYNIFVSSAMTQDGMSTTIATCPRNSSTYCIVANCSDETIINSIATKTYKGDLINMYQFWLFFFVTVFYMIFCSIANSLANPICLDLVEDKPDDYGKQVCWSSIGWAIFSMLVGWLVDRCSVGKTEKDYSPVFYSATLLTLCNLISVYKITIVEPEKAAQSKPTQVLGLFALHHVVVFFIWSAFDTFFQTITSDFLFWYVDDLVSENNDPSQLAWVKTVQGLAQAMECVGEIPLFFWSGWIISAIGGHVNCMALTLGLTAVKMYVYTVIRDPVWIVATELLNGMTGALGMAAKMSYAKTIFPPDTTFTMIGLMGVSDRIGCSLGSFLGGYFIGSYGGVWTFRFFSYSSGFLCILNVLNNTYFGFTKNNNDCDSIEIPTKAVNDSENIDAKN